MRYIALPRGINVSGSNMIKMTDLKAAFEGLGFEKVVTYINSGNLAFDTKKTSETALVKKIAPILEKLAGRPISVMVREQKDILRVLENNPFDGQFESHKQMHVLFLNEPLPSEKDTLLRESDFGSELFVAIGREIYGLMPKGVAESVFSKKAVLDKKPRVFYTARNWRTVEKLAVL